MRKALLIILSILCIAATKGFAGEKDRGITSIFSDRTPHMEKGEWTVGGTASFSFHNDKGYRILVVENVNSNGYNVSASPYVLYGLANDFAVGALVNYKRNMMDLANAGLTVMQAEIGVNDLYSISNKWGFGFFARKYLTLGNSGRFALYVDGGIDFNFGQSKISNNQNGQIIGTYQSDWGAELFVRPGGSFYISNHFAIQAGLGIAGLGFTSVKQVHNQVATGSRHGFSVSYALDFLSLNIGAAISF